MEVQKFISIAPWTMIFQLINLLILMVAFKKYLFKPVMAVLEKRRAEIEGHYEEAEKAESAANAMSKSIVSDAREQASQLKRRAETEIEMERRRAFDEVKGELSGIALDIAQQVIEREVSEKDHEAFINEFIENVGEAS